MATLPGIARSPARPLCRSLLAVLALAGCTRVPEERAADPSVPEAPASAEATTAPAPIPMRVVGAMFRHVADVPEPITPRVAFGPGGAWWHWDGEQATAWIDGQAQPAKLDAAAFLAARPRPPVDRPLAIGSTLVTATSTRTLPDPVVFALRDERAPWGYADTGATFSPDGSLLLVTQEWHPSRCCRERDGEHVHAPDPPRHMGLLFDTATGTRTELPGVQTPSVLGRERLVLSGPQDALYSREPFHPLDAELSLGWSALALTMGMDEAVIATANRASDGGMRLALHRTRDGMRLREWEGPPDAAALAFHPSHPLLAVAGSSRLELWRVDLEAPTRLAHTALAAAPKAIVFHPDGSRLLLTGERGLLFELLFQEQPIGGESSTPLDLALVRDDPSAPPLRAGTDAIAIAIDDTHVHAYGRTEGLYSFDRADGRRVRSWRRRDDEVGGVTFAERAPIVALPERLPLHEARPTRRIDVVDARTYATVGTTWISPGKLGLLRLSPRGTALAWSIEGDPRVTLQAVTGGTLLRMTANTNDVEAIAISDDDRRMAAANRHITDNVLVGTVDETTPLVITTPGGVSRLAFSRDAERLFVMDFGGKIHVVDLARGTVVTSLDPKTSGAGDFVETPDGRHLAVAREGVVVLDVSTGAEVLRVPITTAWVRTVAAAPDGHGLAVGDAEGKLHLFSIP